MTARRIVLTGGGTAGHINPALATAEALVRLRPDVEVEFVGTADRLESRLVPQAGWPLHTVEAAPLRRSLSPTNLAIPLVLARSCAKVRRLLRERNAVAACTFGGYTSGPLALGARLAGVPLVLHEQNAVPGLANRLAAPLAAAIAVSVEAAAPRFPRARRVEVTGNPVRGALSPEKGVQQRAEALAAFGLDPARRTLLVFGGSQGARRLNEAVLDAGGRWVQPERLQILHAAGADHHDRVSAAWRERDNGLLVRCVAYLDRMDLAYAAADLVLSRAGASTVAELTLVGRAAVLVPLPHAVADEQTANAGALVAAGAAVLVRDGDLDGAALVAAAEPLLADADRLSTMGQAAGRLGVPDAADRLALLILDVARASQGGVPQDGPCDER
ncbi:undecaprenyldiphospho-muramoylpentapeptide beta-N-acetylglucosaminyltransferase [soil metagenome]